MFTALQKELREYYGENGGQHSIDQQRLRRLEKNQAEMDAYEADV
jgi:hypothetical protein